MFRAAILTALGIPACAALLSGAITFLAFSYAQNEPPEPSDLAGAITFGVLSLIVVVLTLRASRRNASVVPRISRSAPILVVLGSIGGAYATIAICRDHFASLEVSREGYCREYLEDRATDTAIALCVPETKICEHEVRGSKSGRSFDNLMHECIAKRAGALALMGKLPEARASANDPVKPVYPPEVKEIPPLVQRLCDVLHGLPKRRKAECCQRNPGVILTSECVRNLAGAIAEGSVTVAAESVDACENAMKSAHDGCDWIGPHPPSVPEACLGILRPKRKLNDVCRSSLECPHGLRCLGLGPTETGRCAKPPANGSLCNTGIDPLAVYVRQDDFERRHPACADGFCDRNRCAEKMLTGNACKASDQCMVGRCADGRCIDEPTADVGEPCLGDDCIEGTRCVESKCVETKPAGVACTDSAECKSACIEGKCAMGCDEVPLKKLTPGQKDGPESHPG